MLDTFKASNWTDPDGTPTGGTVIGTGLGITWQEGSLGRGDDRKAPNGAFVETVIASAKQRLEFFERASGGRFHCAENEAAIQCLEEALGHLNERTRKREARQVEGTHEV